MSARAPARCPATRPGRGRLVLALLASLAAALPVPAVEVCARPDELAALNARVLQTTLMVAALSCAHRPLYNAFVSRYQGPLSAQGRALRGFFLRAYGAAGESELNAFITRLANEASRRSSNGHTDFCAGAAAVFARAMDGPPADHWSADPALASVHAYGACDAPVRQAAALD